MNNAPERSRPEQEPAASPYTRLPMPLIALVLFVFLAVLLGIGLYANRNLRPQGIVVPTPLPEASGTSVPPIAAVATPTPAAPAVVAATATTAPTPLILTLASPTPSPQPPAPSATPIPAATESPTPLPTVEPILAAEVGKAYENFWRVKSQALLNLDPTHLPDVMDGDYLETTTNLIEELRSEGHAIKTQVSLDYTVVQAGVEAATVVDFFVDNSIYVKIGTEDPLSTPVADRLSVLYRLQKQSQLWKVVESVRSP